MILKLEISRLHFVPLEMTIDVSGDCFASLEMTIDVSGDCFASLAKTVLIYFYTAFILLYLAYLDSRLHFVPLEMTVLDLLV